MENYQREREQQIEEMVPVVGVFTLLFMCIALLNIPFSSSSTPFLSFALVPILIYLLVFRVGKVWQVLLPGGRDIPGKNRWIDYINLAAGMGLMAVMVYITGGTHSSFKFLFLPVILVYSLRYGLAWGAAACTLAGAAIFFLAWQSGAGAVRNIFLEADLVIIAIFYLVNWLVAKPYQELIHSFVIIERSRRLAAVGEMAAATAHEIRNPLTTLRGSLQILQYSLREKDPDCYRQQDDSFRLMLAEIDRMNNIVSDMLLFARPTHPRPQVLDLNRVVKDMGVLLDSRARLRGIELRLTLSRDTHLVAVDQDQIKQVVLNIVGNAFDAMPGGGIVELAVSRQGRRVKLQISDNGPGIAPEHLPKVFEPFYTANKEGGTGLGLAISYRLVQGNGGSLSVRSKQGQGTAFTIDFPVVANPNGEQTPPKTLEGEEC